MPALKVYVGDVLHSVDLEPGQKGDVTDILHTKFGDDFLPPHGPFRPCLFVGPDFFTLHCGFAVSADGKDITFTSSTGGEARVHSLASVKCVVKNVHVRVYNSCKGSAVRIPKGMIEHDAAKSPKVAAAATAPATAPATAARAAAAPSRPKKTLESIIRRSGK